MAGRSSAGKMYRRKWTYKAVEGDCRAGYSGQRTYIRDFERDHWSGKPVGKSMQKRIFPGADGTGR